MQIRWFKLYDEIIEDRKAQNLPGDTFKFWVNVLAIANKQKVRGILPPVEDIAFALRLSVEETNSRLAELLSLRMLDETPSGLSPHNWKERQKRSDSTSTERSRRHRANRDGNATRPATVARPSRDRCTTVRDDRGQKCNEMQRTDKERDKEEYTPPKVSEHTKPVEAKANPSPGESAPHRIPSQPQRTAEDLADVRAAETLLASDLRTEPLAHRLGREHTLSGNMKVAGWKWLRAAEKMVGPAVTDSQRKQFNYFASIAANLDDSDRLKLGAFAPKVYQPDRPVQYHRSPKTIARLAAQGIAVS